MAVEKRPHSATNKKAFDPKKRIEDSIVLSQHCVVLKPHLYSLNRQKPQEAAAGIRNSPAPASIFRVRPKLFGSVYCLGGMRW